MRALSIVQALLLTVLLTTASVTATSDAFTVTADLPVAHSLSPGVAPARAARHLRRESEQVRTSAVAPQTDAPKHAPKKSPAKLPQKGLPEHLRQAAGTSAAATQNGEPSNLRAKEAPKRRPVVRTFTSEHTKSASSKERQYHGVAGPKPKAKLQPVTRHSQNQRKPKPPPVSALEKEHGGRDNSTSKSASAAGDNSTSKSTSVANKSTAVSSKRPMAKLDPPGARRGHNVTPFALVAGTANRTNATAVRKDASSNGRARRIARKSSPVLRRTPSAAFQKRLAGTRREERKGQLKRTRKHRKRLKKHRDSIFKDGSSSSRTHVSSDGLSVLEDGVRGGHQGKTGSRVREHERYATHAGHHEKDSSGDFQCTSTLDCSVLGCFPLAPDDTALLAAPNDTNSLDFTCKQYTPDPGPCRSGLPFYRLAANDMSQSFCYHFCLGKGLDIAGLVNGVECRCGANRRLTGVWESRAPPLHLLFEHDIHLARKVPDDSAKCKILVWNYTGPIVGGALPRGASSYTRADEIYISTIVGISRDYEWDITAAKDYMSGVVGTSGTSASLSDSGSSGSSGGSISSSDSSTSGISGSSLANRTQGNSKPNGGIIAGSGSKDSGGVSGADAVLVGNSTGSISRASVITVNNTSTDRGSNITGSERNLVRFHVKRKQKRRPSWAYSRRGAAGFDKSRSSQWVGLLQQSPQPYAAAPKPWLELSGNEVGYGLFPQIPQGPVYTSGAASSSQQQVMADAQRNMPQQPGRFFPTYPAQSWLQLSDTEQESGSEATGAAADPGAPGDGTCVALTDDGDCTETACRCGNDTVKETLLLATGEECWACASHCNANSNGCAALPCRCDSLNGEVAVASHYMLAGEKKSCIKCLTNEAHALYPWPKPSPHDPQNLKVKIPYVIEGSPSELALDQGRIDVLAEAIQEFEKMIPCVGFKFIPWEKRNQSKHFQAGHYVHVLKPPSSDNWCLAQNGGNRRRTADLTPAVESDWLNNYLRKAKLQGWKGPTLLWMGHCSSNRWLQRVLQELATIAGLQRAQERLDASTEWRDPWTPSVFSPAQYLHQPHLEIFWDNIINESAKDGYKPKLHSYTGSYASGLMDGFAGYMEYDYLSLMHPDVHHSAVDGLGEKKAFRTLPVKYGNGVWDNVVGSARTFSLNDNVQLADMYSCNTDRFFASQGYKQGQTVTSLHYHDLGHMVSSDLSSTQAWVVSQDQQKVEDWIEEKMLQYRWQLSFIRYMPGNNAFTAYMDTNRWARRRTSGTVDQMYHWGVSFVSFKAWLIRRHRDGYVITDMAADGPYLVAIMTRLPSESNVQQSVFWSGNWTHVIHEIKAHAKQTPAYAITSLLQYSTWDDLGLGCCGGERSTKLLFLGANMTVKDCKKKCAEFVNCGSIDVNSTGHCHIFNWDFSCDGLNYECDMQFRTYLSDKKYSDMTTEEATQGLLTTEACMTWSGTAAEAEEKCNGVASCAGIYQEANSSDWLYCQSRPKKVYDDDIWREREAPMNVSAHSHRTEWVVTLSTNTSIVSQQVKMCVNEPEAIQFINQAYANATNPARVTTLVNTHWGGFAIVMSVTLGDTGPPYWSPPTDRLQRFMINAPYIGFL